MILRLAASGCPARSNLRIESLESTSEHPQQAEAPIPVVSGPPIARLGDLWRLGRRQFLRVDARDEAAYRLLMAGERAAAVFTDPRTM